MLKDNIPQPLRHVEVFLIYQMNGRLRSSDFSVVLGRSISDICNNVAIKPLFFNQEKALDYMNFIDTKQCILHAYVPESTIEGHFEGLTFKKENLQPQQIHGYFPHEAKGELYISNQSFDLALLDLVIAPEDPL